MFVQLLQTGKIINFENILNSRDRMSDYNNDSDEDNSKIAKLRKLINRFDIK